MSPHTDGSRIDAVDDDDIELEASDLEDPDDDDLPDTATTTRTITLNKIIRDTTSLYVAGLDPASPPTADDIEANLLAATNDAIAKENLDSGRSGSDRIMKLKRLHFMQVAEIMLRLHRIVQIMPSGQNSDREYDLLVIYCDKGPDRGIYLSSEMDFASIARRYDYAMTSSDFKEVLSVLRERAPRVTRCTDRDLIAVDNGIFDYATKTLLPFDPDKVFLTKNRVAYNPTASNVVIHNDDDDTDWDIESWMQDLSDDEGIPELLWQVLGAIIRPHVRWNKSAWFYSEKGNNGKGTLCELMRNITGPETYASIPIADFSKDFMLEPLMRASAIIVDENDVGTYIDRAANLKSVITNDTIMINRKYKAPVTYQFFGFMVQCLNEFPQIKDKSESFYRRQLFIPFNKSFTGRERKYIKSEYLHRQDVLEYALHRVLHMNYYTFSEPESTKEVLADYKESNDPVRMFWAEFSFEFAWDLLPFPFLYDLYLAWSQRTNPSGAPLSLKNFNKDLLAIIDQDPMWTCIDKRQQIRPAGRMDAPERLIHLYDLKGWMNPHVKGTTDLDKLCRPELQGAYRGIVRAPAVPGGSAARNPTLGTITPIDQAGTA